MFSHITPAFLAAAAGLFGVMAAGPFLKRIADQRKSELDQIQPELDEIQKVWREKANSTPDWRRQMNKELLAVWKAHGISPYQSLLDGILRVLIYLVMWSCLIFASADMLLNFYR